MNSLEDFVFGTLTDISERVIENVQCPYGYQETYCYLLEIVITRAAPAFF